MIALPSPAAEPLLFKARNYGQHIADNVDGVDVVLSRQLPRCRRICRRYRRVTATCVR